MDSLGTNGGRARGLYIWIADRTLIAHKYSQCRNQVVLTHAPLVSLIPAEQQNSVQGHIMMISGCFSFVGRGRYWHVLEFSFFQCVVYEFSS